MSGKKGAAGGGGASNNNENNNNNNGNVKRGIVIPAGSRKMVQSLKEIVNCPETEIYAMLRDCNMDPNETVNRLLSQDPFHEVKSKREKKKENKEMTGPTARVPNYTAHRIATAGVSHDKPAFRKENGTHTYASSSSGSSGTGTNVNRRPTLNSDLMAAENKLSNVGACDEVTLSQPSAGFRSPLAVIPGQISMVDIVKMGRPHSKAYPMPTHQNVNHLHPSAPHLATLKNDVHLLENHSVKVSGVNPEPEVPVVQHVHSNDNWPSIKPAIMPSVLEVPSESELYTDSSNVNLDRGNQYMQSRIDDIQPTEDYHIETLNESHVKPTSVSSTNIQEDGTVVPSMFDSDLHGNTASHQLYRHAFEHETQDGASPVAGNLQQLSLQGDDQAASLENDSPPVIIPNHLHIYAQDCSHLSFGSFRSGISSAFSRPLASGQMKTNLEESSEVVDGSSAVPSDARNPEYKWDGNFRNAADDNLMHRSGASLGSYDLPAVPQPEVLKEETPEAANRDQYAFHSSAPGYTYENSQLLTATFDNLQASTQMQDTTPFINVMQAYTNSLSSTLLASNVQQGREPDLQYSSFPVTQSMPTKYSNAASFISRPNIAAPEINPTNLAIRSPSISTLQQIPHILPGVSAATGLALEQHLAAHSYSQPTLPLGPYANIGYPFLQQGYTYMPSAFQQILADNSTYQSLAAILPQYKNSVSLSSLPQSAAVASAYGFGSSTSIPAGNFPRNPPTAPGGTTMGYDDVLSCQYKDRNNLVTRQNDDSAILVHGPGSRTMSAESAASTFYSLQGQNQQRAGFRQRQQLSQQHFASHGYPNYHHSQTGISLEHQHQISRDTCQGDSHGQPSKQHNQQVWRHSY